MVEWIEYGKTWREFHKDGLAKAGVQVEVRAEKVTNPERLLLGDVNEMGGTCDDCAGIYDADVVVRYRRVFAKDAP